MAISDILNEAKDSVKELLRREKFNRANMERKKAAELQSALAKCRGQLEICRKDLERTVRAQSRHIREGEKEGMDTAVQEQLLWDGAIGYMLVKDAIFSLKTVSSSDSVSHAYEMLEAAIRQMSGKKGKLPAPFGTAARKERNSHGYITSEAALRAKEEQLESIFESLKETGDIESCLLASRNASDIQAERRNAYTGGMVSPGLSAPSGVSDLDMHMARLNSLPDAGDEEDDEDLSALGDIRPPEDR